MNINTKRALVALAALSIVGSGAGAAQAEPASYTLRVQQTAPNVAAAVRQDTAAATCKVNQIVISRYGECESTTITVTALKNRVPVGTAEFNVYHSMQVNQLSRSWSESIQYSKAAIVGDAGGIEMTAAATAVGTTRASLSFPEGHILGAPFSAGVKYSDSVGSGKVNLSRTTYRYTFIKPGYSTGTVAYESAYYRCDDTFKGQSAGCVFRDAPGVVSMVGLTYIDGGIRALRAHGGHYGDPNGGSVLHALADSKKASKNRTAVCGKAQPTPAEKAAGRTWCDEYPFAATYEGGTSLSANQREITFTTPAEQRSQGGRITAFKKKFRILDRDPFYVIA